MPSVRKSVIVPHACDTMFALVDDVESYPEFLPWCPRTRVLERSRDVTRACIDIDFHGLKSHFTTRNFKQPPGAMTLELVEGPFESLAGEWRFAPLGREGCRVELAIDYTLSSGPLEALVGLVFGQIVETLVERFVERAAAMEPGK